mmetsp:Transcript_32714/g.53052  ORF Transcript_32714/g.53052 Transcript_32714/m.53052 type:complete len:727 (+) Transcript_32714:464-2644(+)
MNIVGDFTTEKWVEVIPMKKVPDTRMWCVIVDLPLGTHAFKFYESGKETRWSASAAYKHIKDNLNNDNNVIEIKNPILPSLVDKAYAGSLNQYSDGIDGRSACTVMCCEAAYSLLKDQSRPSLELVKLVLVIGANMYRSLHSSAPIPNARPEHMSFDEVYPMVDKYNRHLGIKECLHGRTDGLEPFQPVLAKLKRCSPACAVVTKPPETVLLFRGIDLPWVLFDSHTRKERDGSDRGAAFLEFKSEEGVRTYLEELFPFTYDVQAEYNSYEATILALVEDQNTAIYNDPTSAASSSSPTQQTAMRHTPIPSSTSLTRPPSPSPRPPSPLKSSLRPVSRPPSPLKTTPPKPSSRPSSPSPSRPASHQPFASVSASPRSSTSDGTMSVPKPYMPFQRGIDDLKSSQRDRSSSSFDQLASRPSDLPTKAFPMPRKTPSSNPASPRSVPDVAANEDGKMFDDLKHHPWHPKEDKQRREEVLELRTENHGLRTENDRLKEEVSRLTLEKQVLLKRPELDWSAQRLLEEERRVHGVAMERLVEEHESIRVRMQQAGEELEMRLQKTEEELDMLRARESGLDTEIRGLNERLSRYDRVFQMQKESLEKSEELIKHLDGQKRHLEEQSRHFERQVKEWTGYYDKQSKGEGPSRSGEQSDELGTRVLEADENGGGGAVGGRGGVPLERFLIKDYVGEVQLDRSLADDSRVHNSSASKGGEHVDTVMTDCPGVRHL